MIEWDTLLHCCLNGLCHSTEAVKKITVKDPFKWPVVYPLGFTHALKLLQKI